MTLKTINVAEFDAPLPSVTFADGSAVPIKPITGVGMKLRDAAYASAKDADFFACVRTVLPDATDAQIDELTGAAVLSIIAIASGQADLVLRVIADRQRDPEGNSPGPRATAPDSASPTQSAA